MEVSLFDGCYGGGGSQSEQLPPSEEGDSWRGLPQGKHPHNSWASRKHKRNDGGKYGLKMETKETVQISDSLAFSHIHSFTRLYAVGAYARTRTHTLARKQTHTRHEKCSQQPYIHTVLSKIHSELENVAFSLSTSEFAICTSIPFTDILRLQNTFPSFCEPI